jgi:hypothetical protein
MPTESIMIARRLAALKHLAARTTAAFTGHLQHCGMSAAQAERALLYFIDAAMANETRNTKSDGVR